MTTKLLDDIRRIGDWIQDCKTAEQLSNLQNHYNTIVSKQWYSDIKEDSLAAAIEHLNKMLIEKKKQMGIE